jgi:hypothetical protein
MQHKEDTNTKGHTLLGMPSTPLPAMGSVVWSSGPAAAAMAAAIGMLLWGRFLALVALTDLPGLEDLPALEELPPLACSRGGEGVAQIQGAPQHD